MFADKVKEIIASADERIKDVVVKHGPGSDGPFIQADYYVTVTLQNAEKLDLSVYLAPRSYKIPLRTRDDPHAELINKLSDAVGTIMRY